MGPTHTRRNGQRFRYYVTHPKSVEQGSPAAYRVAAEPMERHCVTLLGKHLTNSIRSIDGPDATEVLRGENKGERRALILEHVRKIIVGDAKLTMEMADGKRLLRALERVRHGNDAKLIVGDLTPPARSLGNQQLIILLQDAARAQALALAKPRLTLNELAAKFGRSPERFKRLIRLSYLSPRIVTSILKGTQPSQLTSRTLQHLDGLPLSWSEQEAMLLA